MTNTFTQFKDLGIKSEIKSFTGDKIKIGKVLNRMITVYDYKIEDSKFKGKCLHLSIDLNGSRHVVFTGSSNLVDMIQRVPKDKFPFITTIVEENERFEFT